MSMTTAADLLALQEIDLRRESRRALLADIQARLAEAEALLAAREALAEAEAELKRAEERQREIEARLDDLDAKIRPLEKKLYDGSVRNPKELSDMQKELELLKSRRRQLDDEGLAQMEAIEAAAAAKAAAHSQLRAVEEEWQRHQDALLAEQSRVEAEMARLEEERARRAQDIERPALSLYESLRSARQGRAVARVERGACQGCRISLPTHLQQQLRAADHLVQCPSCERILVGG